MYFSVNVSYASLPVYLPTILSKMGYSSINAQGLSAPPYFAAFLFANITTFIADRTQQRGLVLIITSLVGGIGYIVLATVRTVGVRYFAVYLAAAGVFSTIPNILAWTLSLFMNPPQPSFPSSPILTILTSEITRQSRQRYPSRRRTGHNQRRRTVWPNPGHEALSHEARAKIYQGDEYLCRLHVLRGSNGLRPEMSPDMGEWEARPEIQRQDRKRKGHGSNRCCCGGRLWPGLPLCSLTEW